MLRAALSAWEPAYGGAHVPFQVGRYVGGRCTRMGSFASLGLIPPRLPGVGAAPHQVSSRLSSVGESTRFA